MVGITGTKLEMKVTVQSEALMHQQIAWKRLETMSTEHHLVVDHCMCSGKALTDMKQSVACSCVGKWKLVLFTHSAVF